MRQSCYCLPMGELSWVYLQEERQTVIAKGMTPLSCFLAKQQPSTSEKEAEDCQDTPWTL